MHESFDYYLDCRLRQRNTGLFIADRVSQCFTFVGSVEMGEWTLVWDSLPPPHSWCSCRCCHHGWSHRSSGVLVEGGGRIWVSSEVVGSKPWSQLHTWSFTLYTCSFLFSLAESEESKYSHLHSSEWTGNSTWVWVSRGEGLLPLLAPHPLEGRWRVMVIMLPLCDFHLTCLVSLTDIYINHSCNTPRHLSKFV